MSKSFWLLSAGAFALATPAYAQDEEPTATTDSGTEQAAVQEADETAEDEDGETIYVTAQGRRQLLQDVPLAVQAVGGQQMQNSGASDIRQLNQLAPSLLVSSTGSEGNGSARVRGIGTVGDNPGLESSVAVFIDGVYRSRSGIGLNELGEVERIEVARGPQGTLFGRNASAGLIHVITRRPEFTFGGMAELTYGNYDHIRAQGAVTGPLTDTLAFRLDAVYVRRDGFYDVVNAAGGTESHVNDRNRILGRGQLLFEPNDALSVRLIADYSTRDESCCGAVVVSAVEVFDPTPGAPNTNPQGDFAFRTNRFLGVLADFGGVPPSVGGDPYDRQIAISPGRTYEGETTDWGASLQLDYDFGGATLTSITAYRDYRNHFPADIDYTSVDIWYRADDDNAFRDFGTFTQEVRLQGSAFGGVLDWLIGGYYANEDLHVRDNITYGSQYGPFAACRLVATLSPAIPRSPTSPGCLNAVGRSILALPAPTGLGAAAPIVIAGLDRLSTVVNVGDNFSNYFQDSSNWAVFTHNIFNITDTLSLTVGLRYTSEHKDFSADFNNTNTICPTQQAFFAPFLPGGAQSAPFAPLAPFLAGIVNFTCQGNNSSLLNGLNLSDERDESEWTGTGVLSFRPRPGLLLYASYSRGYKAGGFNLDRSALGQPIFTPTDPRQFGGRAAGFGTVNLQFDPEIVDAYELGFKWTRRYFTLNVAAFHQAFENFQLNTFNGSVFLVQNINGCSNLIGGSGADEDLAGGLITTGPGGCDPDDVRPGVLSTGIEVEAAVYPRRDLQFTAGVTYANTRYRDDLVGADTGIPLDPALFLLPGDNLSNAPEWVATGSVTWTPRIGNSGITGLVYIDSRLSSGYNTGSDLFVEKEQDSFVLFNARLGIRGPGQRWAVELWAQNLFDEDYQQVAFNTPFQGNNTLESTRRFGVTANTIFSSFLAEPRTYGITGRFRF